MANVPPSQMVLIVDDEGAAVRVLQAALKERFAVVDGVESPAKALEKLRHRTYGVLFVDFKMPGMDGLSFIQQIRHMEIFTPAILFSGFITTEITLRAFQLGVIDLIAKPPDLFTIWNTAEDILHRFSPEERQDTRSLNHAKRLLHRCQFSEAKALLEGLAENPNNPEASLLLAMTCEVMGAFNEAEVTYKKTLQHTYAEDLDSSHREWLKISESGRNEDKG
jgi:DNA-binding NtrC family response regulator